MSQATPVIRTFCVYPRLRTLGGVTDCPEPQGNLPVASDNARGVDTLCVATLPTWHGHGFVRSFVLPVVTRAPTSSLREKVERAVARPVVVIVANNISTPVAVVVATLLWRARYGYCVMHITRHTRRERERESERERERARASAREDDCTCTGPMLSFGP